MYERTRNYDLVAKKIARRVRSAARGGRKVAYCVDGSVFEDSAAALLLRKKNVRFMDGRSKAERLAALAHLGEYTSSSAYTLAEKQLALPLVVYDLCADNVGDVKLLLAEKYGDETPVLLAAGKKVRFLPLYEIDRFGEMGYENAGLIVPNTPLLEKKKYDFDDLIAILRRLRAPDGCPWDKVQTHESIRIDAVEEAYELVDAIDRDDPDRILEESGDVLMQSAFHALIEEEKGHFTVADMVSAICEKLITRHTHVFGSDRAESAEGALSVWDKNKMKEKHQTTFSDAVTDVPMCFPALLRAQKIAKRAQKGGWDKPDISLFERQFREEYGELLEAVKGGDPAKIAAEYGDLLLCTVNLGRAVGADAEQSLADAAKKLQARYVAYETLVRADGKDVLTLSEEEKEDYYRRVKESE